MTARPEFVHCYDTGRRFFSRNFVLFVASRVDRAQPWRLGTAVTKKTGNAVKRNRVRRLIREFFRLEQNNVPMGFDYVVVPKRQLNPKELTLKIVEMELLPLLHSVKKRQP